MKIVASVALLVAVLGALPASAQTDAEAVADLRVRAEQGDAEAQAKLGEIYKFGEGVQQDDAESLRWYRLAAAQGNATAQISHPGPKFGTLAGQSPRTCVTRLPSWAPPRAPRRTPRGPRVRSPSDLLADAERPPAVRTP